MPTIVRMNQGSEIERLEARIEMHEKMFMKELENIRRLNIYSSPHLAALTQELKRMYIELGELKKKEE